jgi:hypothetical protein
MGLNEDLTKRIQILYGRMFGYCMNSAEYLYVLLVPISS